MLQRHTGTGQCATEIHWDKDSVLQRLTRTRAACYRDTLGQGQCATEIHWDKGSVLQRHTGTGSVLQRYTVSHHWLDMVELNCSSDTPDTETSLVRHSPNVKDEARFILGECKQFNSPL